MGTQRESFTLESRCWWPSESSLTIAVLRMWRTCRSTSMLPSPIEQSRGQASVPMAAIANRVDGQSWPPRKTLAALTAFLARYQRTVTHTRVRQQSRHTGGNSRASPPSHKEIEKMSDFVAEFEHIDPPELVQRNATFAASGAFKGLPFPDQPGTAGDRVCRLSGRPQRRASAQAR